MKFEIRLHKYAELGFTVIYGEVFVKTEEDYIGPVFQTSSSGEEDYYDEHMDEIVGEMKEHLANAVKRGLVSADVVWLDKLPADA